MKKILTLISAIAIANISFAQIAGDAFALSHNFPTGTARFNGMGGSMGAIGGDASSMWTNPAGLGFYRGTEFTITPSLQFNKAKTSFGTGRSENKTVFDAGSMGIVGAMDMDNGGSGLKFLTLGLGYNRIANYGKNTVFAGSNMNSSILDMWAGTASNWVNANPSLHDPGIPGYYFPDELRPGDEGLAYDQYLIDLDNDDDNPVFPDYPAGYYSVQELYGHGHNMIRRKEQKGYIDEWNLSMGGNINHQFYFGLSIGIQDIDYKEWISHYETGASGSDLNYFEYMQDLRISGYGANIKLGAIYRPIDEIRIGAAYHSPTWMNLTNEYQPGLYSLWNVADSYGNKQDEKWDYLSVYDFKLRTPGKWLASAAVQFGQYGMLNVDYEYINYASMKMSNDGNGSIANSTYFDEVNDVIKNSYRAVNNLRVGGELKTGLFSWRAGYGLYGNPYCKETINSDASYSTISGGLGFRVEGFFVDLSYTQILRKESESLYDSVLVYTNGAADYNPVVSKIDTSTGRLLLTLGFRF